MFDFAWSEIAVIAAVALLAIGPKDMPVAIRTVAGMVKKARRMASEFQTHVDEMVREANLEDVRNQFNDIRNFDFKGELERQIDPDGSMRDTLTDNPFESTSGSTDGEQAVAEAPVLDLPRPDEVDRVQHAAVAAPAFIPPNAVPPEPLLMHEHEADSDPEPPAFIPPEVALERRSRPQA